MRLVDRRGVLARCGVFVMAVVLGFGPGFGPVRAQEHAPLGGDAVIASGGETVLLRDQPGYEAVALTPLADGSVLTVAGDAVVGADGSSWLPIVSGGQSGYVPAGYVTAAPAPIGQALVAPLAPSGDAEMTATNADSGPAAVEGGSTATTTDANLRSGPSGDAPVLVVLPPGTTVSVDGEPSNGFLPVTGWGVSGWIATDLVMGAANAADPPAQSDQAALLVPGAATESVPLTTTPVVADPVTSLPAPALEAAEVSNTKSTGIVWPMAGGEWEVVQGYNNGTHTNRSGFAQYANSLDWARVDGDTAGQPVFAPVSGTIQWTDRGSGGLLIDAGNGYGVALFHITLDRGLARNGSVERGQRVGQISGPGGDGYMSMAHVDMTVWRLTGRGHEATPFVGVNAIAGQEFPDSGAANEHMGARIAL